MDLVAQPLDLQVLEVVVLVVLDDDFLQVSYFALHPGAQLSLHFKQSLEEHRGKDESRKSI